MPAPPFSRRLPALFAPVLVLSCSAPPPAPHVAAAPPAGAYGVILAQRTVPPLAARDARTTILAALGAPGAAADAGPAREFIVRAADGGTLSVVQIAADGLRPGARVAILRTPRTLLVPADAATRIAAGG